MEQPAKIEELHTLLHTLIERLSVLEAENVSLRQENEKLRQENSDLRVRLSMDSGNSHKPPSSDGYKKKSIKSMLPKAEGKQQGGQKGHTGKSLKMVAIPDKVEICLPIACQCCGRHFASKDCIEEFAVGRQVFDVPCPRLEVTEYRLGVVCCCGVRQQGSFPRSVAAPVQYGARALSLASMLNVDFRLPFAKISELFADIYGASLNESTIVSGNLELYECMEQVEENIKAGLSKSEVAHFDETGMRVAGSLHWFHAACSKSLCYLFVDAHRGEKALKSPSSILPNFRGWAVHDCWVSYFQMEQSRHALCNAHLLRELQALVEQGSLWAEKMKTLLLDLYKASDHGRGVVADFDTWQHLYELICSEAHKQEPTPLARPRGKPKNSKGRNLLNRLRTYQEGVLAFAQVKAVPFTNNTAEQDLRVVKIKQKVSMCFRTLKGVQVYARMQGVIKTIRKQGLNLWQTLTNMLTANTTQIVYT